MSTGKMRKVRFDDFCETVLQRSSSETFFADFFNLREIMKIWNQQNPIIAGGCLRDLILNKPINDIDVFFEDRKSFESAQRCIVGNVENECLHEGRRSNKYKVRQVGVHKRLHKPFEIDLIHCNFEGSPAKLISTFDFTICQFALKEGFIYYPTCALSDLIQRNLKFATLKKETIPNTFRRMHRFLNEGYVMDWYDQKQIFEHIQGSNMPFGDAITSSGAVLEFDKSEEEQGVQVTVSGGGVGGVSPATGGGPQTTGGGGGNVT